MKSDVVPNPYANMMGLAKISEGDFDRVVDAVFAAYAGAPFGWVVGPLSQPQDLGQRLLARGLVLAEEMLGMVLDDLATPIPENDNVVIRRLTPEEVPDYADGLALAYGMGITGDAIKVVALGSRGDLFIVQPQGSDEVIGFSRMAYVTDDVVLLGGSAVSEAWRGRGIYKTLVAARLRLARQAGAKRRWCRRSKIPRRRFAGSWDFGNYPNMPFILETPSRSSRSPRVADEVFL